RLHLALSRASALLAPPAEREPVVASHRPEHRRTCELALVGLPAARDLRREPDRLHVLHVVDDAAVAAGDDDGPPARLHLLPAQLPDRARHLLGDDEPLDGGAGRGDAPARREDAGAAKTFLEDAPETGGGARRRRRSPPRALGAEAGSGRRAAAAAAAGP